MLSTIRSFELTDLQANRRGELSPQQRHDLTDYIDEQGTVFIWHLMISGVYIVVCVGAVMRVAGGQTFNIDTFNVTLIIALLVGVMIMPYSLRHLIDSYQALQCYRDDQTQRLTGVCHIYAIPNRTDRYSVVFGDSRTFFIYSENIAAMPEAGEVYHVYHLGDVILSFEAA